MTHELKALHGSLPDPAAVVPGRSHLGADDTRTAAAAAAGVGASMTAAVSAATAAAAAAEAGAAEAGAIAITVVGSPPGRWNLQFLPAFGLVPAFVRPKVVEVEVPSMLRRAAPATGMSQAGVVNGGGGCGQALRMIFCRIFLSWSYAVTEK